MFKPGLEVEKDALYEVAHLMCLAARTAPKGGGVDGIVTAVVGRAVKDTIAAEMRRIGEEQAMKAYLLNAKDVEESEWVVLIGMKLKRYGVKTCDFCGYDNCKKNKEANGICAIAVGDLGIAIGSAVSVAGRHHADNRIMFTIGKAALNLTLLGEEVRIAYGIPLSAKGKNIFFDKDWKKAYGVEGWAVK
ncbi:MAG: DUF2148 domain-containing protein [Pseudomonadota bacterium]